VEGNSDLQLPSPTFLMAQTIFETNPFPYDTPTFLYLVHSTRTYLPMKMEQTECSERSAYKLQTLGNHPEESIQRSEHGERLKSRNIQLCLTVSIC